MGKLSKRQNGNSVVVVLLIIVVVGVVGFVGWYVFKHKNTLNNANVPTISNTTNKTTSASASPNSDATTIVNGYLVIERWGVEIKLPANLDDAMIWNKASLGNDEIALTSNTIEELATSVGNTDQCGGVTGPQTVYVQRFYVGEQNPGPYGGFSDTGPVLTQADLDNAVKTYGAHVGKYYYVVQWSPPGFCVGEPGANSSTAKQIDAYQLEIAQAISSMKAVN